MKILQEALPEAKRLLQLALPLIAAVTAQKALQLVCTLLMGLIGTYALAGGALAHSCYTIIWVGGFGLLNTVGILIAQAQGARQINKTTPYLHHGWYACILISLPLMLLLWFIPDMLLASNQDPLVTAQTKAYLHGAMWGLPGLLAFFTLREFTAALNKARMIVWVAAAAIPVNGLLGYAFVSGKLGLPALGMAGIGYSNAITEWLLFISLLIYSAYHPALRSYQILAKFTAPQRHIFTEIFRIGIPNSVILIVEVGMCTATVVMMGYFGAVALAAHQIAFQCLSFAYMIPLGMSLALSLRVGEALGANDLATTIRALYIGLGLSFICAACIALIFYFGSTFLINLYIHPSEQDYSQVMQLATTFFIIAAIFHIFDAAQGILNGALRGFKDTFVPMLIALFCFIIFAIGGGYLLAFQFHFHAVGLWCGLALGIGLSSFILALRLYQQARKRLEKSLPEIGFEYLASS